VEEFSSTRYQGGSFSFLCGEWLFTACVVFFPGEMMGGGTMEMLLWETLTICEGDP
jgi:hypothetical protein